MATVFQTIDVDVETTKKPTKLKSASEYPALVCETLQNYEFESKGFVHTSATKPVGAALIAPMVESFCLVCHAPVVHSSCSKCFGCDYKSQSAPLHKENLAFKFWKSKSILCSFFKPTTLVSEYTTNGGEGYDWSAHSEEPKLNSVNQALMVDVKGKESSEKVSSV
ncbi:hypothetical protein L1987_01754 [Smallanthus sonchifolius]|uniref:Uncharacterized protein n=1 Tax=Smallanthus sonchifolius TaxID=185202 RepID=A0ACB9K5W9_9ASTR|nr:hypothetical protein L1987_01754 [Smallanthus sonchifolius]